MKKEWIVIFKAERGWVIGKQFDKGNDAKEFRRIMLSNDSFEDVMVAYNPFHSPR